ncbi:MAG: nucleotidyltransferase domain-containing protein [Nanoarchaeota archaeon]|nr:nucleotidyltransferase domain-containing protein [Nanoarchaeota archaeon]
MKSKEEDVLSVFYNHPTKHWHFNQLVKEIGIADSKLDSWLKKFILLGLVERIKIKGEMPFYISNFKHPEYQNRKRIYALQVLHEIGFLNHIVSLQGVKTAIVFGSFARWDWHWKSDLDLFLFGNSDEFEISRYEKVLKREIQVFEYKNLQELRKLHEDLMKNIIKGYVIKGNVDFLKVSINENKPNSKRSPKGLPRRRHSNAKNRS